MEEILEIIKEGKRWEAFTLYNKQDSRIAELSEENYQKFMLLIELAKESL